MTEFIGNQTDFGGSDSPLKPRRAKCRRQLTAAAATRLEPAAVFGPIAITYNVPGVDGLVLDGPTLAKIFNGTVTTWDAPEITALNQGSPSGAADQRDLPQRRVGHHRQLPEVP